MLCTVELIVEHSLTSFYEWFADLTLAFGMLPNADISVVGVGWFLGVVFAFYMVFPFFVFLIGNKKRAWMVMGIAIVANILCQVYFFDENHVVRRYAARTNLLCSSIFFVAGGLIYLYREKIKVLIQFRWVVLIATGVSVVSIYIFRATALIWLVLCALLTIMGILGGRGTEKVIFQNRVVRFLSSISMEIYLCHMFVYRVAEKARILHSTGNELLNYVATCIATLSGAVVMSLVLKKIIVFAGNKLKK